MHLQTRPIEQFEQPHVLIARLQHATHVNEHGESIPVSKVLVGARRLFQPSKTQFIGVPHGVTRAIVLARNIEIRWKNGKPFIYFCQSNNYRVLAPTIDKFDNGDYPNEDQCLVSGNIIPSDDGYYNSRMRVSVNGALKVHFEKLFPITATSAF